MPRNGSLGGRAIVAIFLYAILFLFFIQLLTDFIAGIYAFGLLGSGLPVELAAVLLFLSPFLLLLIRHGLSTGLLIVVGELILLCRAVEIILPTRYQLLVAGLGTALFLFLFPAILWQRGQRRDSSIGLTLTAGLVLAVALALALRALGSTFDISGDNFQVIAWLLTLGAAALLPGVFRAQPEPLSDERLTDRPATRGKVIGLSIGLITVFLLLYFAFASPIVIARWTRFAYLPVLLLSVLALVLFSWLLAFGKQSFKWATRKAVLVVTALFTLVLTLTLLLNHSSLSLDAAAYPLMESDSGAAGNIIVILLLLLYPVIFLDFKVLGEEMIRVQPTLRQLGLGFGLASLFLLVMTLAHVFTSVWAYIDPILAFVSRNRFWQVHFVAGLVLTLSILAVNADTVQRVRWPSGRSFAALVTLTGLVALLAAFVRSPYLLDPSIPGNSSSAGPGLKIAGYNVHQGYDVDGQRSHHDQCAVLAEIDADVIGLSETDTARVAGSNVDIVHFLADCLQMHAYSGPRTGVGSFGYALLSKYPIESAETFHLFSGPGHPGTDDPETTSDGDQVAVIRAQIQVGDELFTIFINHFDSNPPVEQPQGFVGLLDGLEHVVAVGDYNCAAGTPCFEIINQVLIHCPGVDEADDSPIDHIFISNDLRCSETTYVNSSASDHPAVTANINR